MNRGVPAFQVEAWHRPLWWVLLAGAFCIDVLSTPLGSVIFGPGGYVLIWTAALLAYPRVSFQANTASWVPWAFPVLTLVSVVWSAAPDVSLKGGIFNCFTVAATLLMVRRLPPRDVILALLAVTLTGGIASLVIGTQRDALIGIYGSKNGLSFYAALLMLSATAILLDRQQRTTIRLLALLGCLLAPILLIRGQSTGALVGAALGTGVLVALFSISLLRRSLRAPYLFCGAVLGLTVAGLAGAALTVDPAFFLGLVGKQADLTGRTYLWERAAELIEMKPLLGHGLYGFWTQGSVEAEGLWRHAKIASRAGFHFHNLYYETAIELGMVGVVFQYATIIATTVAVLIWAIRRPGIESAFFAAFITFLDVRSFGEVEIGGPLGLHCMIYISAWMYARHYERLVGIWSRPLQPVRLPAGYRARSRMILSPGLTPGQNPA